MRQYLKIKDDVDLKELEKFGFTKKIKYYSNDRICVDKKTRVILCCNIGYSAYGDFVANKNMYNSQRLYIDGTLLDLINNGLVEKVVVNEETNNKK